MARPQSQLRQRVEAMADGEWIDSHMAPDLSTRRKIRNVLWRATEVTGKEYQVYESAKTHTLWVSCRVRGDPT